jgi:phage gp46-like protein
MGRVDDIIRKRLEGVSLAALGREYGITRERVRQLQEEGIAELGELGEAVRSSIREAVHSLTGIAQGEERRKFRRLVLYGIRRGDWNGLCGLLGIKGDRLAVCQEIYNRLGICSYGDWTRCSRCGYIGDSFSVGSRFCKECRRVEQLERMKTEYWKAYFEEYRKLPEVKERMRAYQREWSRRPEAKERIRAYQREWSRRPEVKERIRAYYSDPEVRERKNENQRKWWASKTPEEKSAICKMRWIKEKERNV